MKKRLLSAILAFSLLFTLASSAFAALAYHYTETEKTMIASMMGAFLKNKDADPSAYLAEIRREDAVLADAYGKIMDYWKAARTTMKVNRFNPDPGAYHVSAYSRIVSQNVDEIPDGLVQDNAKLCIVCLGFALNADGSMKNELYGRLLTAYEVWLRYPGSYIAVTGGGTASGNRSVTEGGQMRSFLTEELGVPAQYVICEDKAPNTSGNALNTMDILHDGYPGVDSLLMVTSDYHVARGSTFFNTTAQLYRYQTGKEYRMVGNCGFATDTAYENSSPSYSSLYSQMYTICGIPQNTPVVDPPASGCQHQYRATLVEPTCENGGYTLYSCALCDKEYRGDETPKLGHEFGSWTTVTEPGCESEGLERRSCIHAGCGRTETRSIRAMGHEYGDWTTVTEPGCESEGLEKRSCIHAGCDKSETRPLSALGHDYRNGVCSRCGADEPLAPMETRPVTGVSLSRSKLTLDVDGTAQLSATVQPADADDQSVSWKSGNDAVATVDGSGKVIAVAAGKADITVTTGDGGYRAVCSVTVNQPAAPIVHVSGITLEPAEIDMAKGGTVTLKAAVLPANADNRKVVWTSGRDSVASVDENGRVTAKAAGKAVITATTEDGSLAASCTVNVWGLGDVNHNGVVDTDDAMAVLQYNVGRTPKGRFDLSLADVSGDGAADTDDAMLILRFDVRKITAFPAEGK